MVSKRVEYKVAFEGAFEGVCVCVYKYKVTFEGAFEGGAALGHTA